MNVPPRRSLPRAPRRDTCPPLGRPFVPIFCCALPGTPLALRGGRSLARSSHWTFPNSSFTRTVGCTREVKFPSRKDTHHFWRQTSLQNRALQISVSCCISSRRVDQFRIALRDYKPEKLSKLHMSSKQEKRTAEAFRPKENKSEKYLTCCKSGELCGPKFIMHYFGAEETYATCTCHCGSQTCPFTCLQCVPQQEHENICGLRSEMHHCSAATTLQVEQCSPTRNVQSMMELAPRPGAAPKLNFSNWVAKCMWCS